MCWQIALQRKDFKERETFEKAGMGSESILAMRDRVTKAWRPKRAEHEHRMMLIWAQM